MAAALPYLADALVVVGVLVMTVGVYGMVRMPGTYTRLHAASKMVFLGVCSLLLASTVTGDADIVLRCLLIGIFLVLTTPVSGHVIGQAAFQKGEEPGKAGGAAGEARPDGSNGGRP